MKADARTARRCSVAPAGARRILLGTGLFALLAQMTACQGPPADVERAIARFSTGDGRNLQSISTDKKTGKWLLAECSEALTVPGCHILTYDPRSNHLRRYALSDRYLYAYPRFSEDGTQIVTNRFPKHDGSAAGMAASVARSEIIIFGSAGGGLRVLVREGSHVGPALSPTGRYLAYWKTIPATDPRSRMRSKSFDLVVWDIEKQSEEAFSGMNDFYAGGRIYFESDDEIVSEASTPTKRTTENLQEYRRKTNGSEVFHFSRGSAPRPVFTEIQNARSFSLDAAGNSFVYGQKDLATGSRFFKFAKNGESRSVPAAPVEDMVEASCEADGQSLLFIYAVNKADFDARRLRIGRANFSTGSTEPLAIPPLSEAEVVEVN